MDSRDDEIVFRNRSSRTNDEPLKYKLSASVRIQKYKILGNEFGSEEMRP